MVCLQYPRKRGNYCVNLFVLALPCQIFFMKDNNNNWKWSKLIYFTIYVLFHALAHYLLLLFFYCSLAIIRDLQEVLWMGQVARNEDRIIVCLMDVIKYTLNHLIWKLIWELIPVKSHINASGKVVRGSSPVQTSWHDITVNTLVCDLLNALNVNVLSRALIISLCTWRDMLMNWKNLPKSTYNVLSGI